MSEHSPYPARISWSELRKMLSRLTKDEDVIDKVLFIISYETHNNDFDVAIPQGNGTFVGLGQFNSSTWKSVSELPFSKALEIEPSLQALIALVKANEKYHVRKFPEIGFSKEIAYLYHNQGAPSAKSFLLSKELTYPDQSIAARKLFRQLATEV